MLTYLSSSVCYCPFSDPTNPDDSSQQRCKDKIKARMDFVDTLLMKQEGLDRVQITPENWEEREPYFSSICYVA